MAHELPALPYDYSALEPHIDEATMKFHHDKHHQAYIDKLNGAIEKHPDLAQHSAEDLLKNLQSLPEDVRGIIRNNGGGHVNHTMFWEIMAPKAGGPPTGKLGEQITKDFGAFDDFKKQFNEKTAAQFGSGWGWLLWDGTKLIIATTPNQGQPPHPGPLPHPRQRHLGACLLSEVPEQTPGISGSLVECCELGGSRKAVC